MSLPYREREGLQMSGHAGVITREGVVTSWKGDGHLASKGHPNLFNSPLRAAVAKPSDSPVPASSEGSVGSRD